MTPFKLKLFSNTPNKSVTVDGGEHWLSRSVAVGTVVCCIHEGVPYFLVMKRGNGVPSAGKLCFVCGFLDYDETLEEAVIRETWEESGLDLMQYDNLLPEGLAMPWRIHSVPKGRQNVTLFYSYVFRADELPRLTIQDPAEVAEVTWKTLPSLNRIAPDEFAFSHKQLLQKWLRSEFEKAGVV